MRISNWELWTSAFVIAVIGGIYLSIVSYSEMPTASSLAGHSLGVLGFVLMLMTETLYSLRKRYRYARWGKLRNWLSFHIFTGLVGPFLVLLHTSWNFRGLAGVLTLMTLVIVASGFVGRYFYTSIPRSLDGSLLDSNQIQQQVDQALVEFQAWKSVHLDELNPMTAEHFSSQPSLSRENLKILEDSAASREARKEFQTISTRYSTLEGQLLQMERTRKLLAIWHTIHVPVGLSLFLVAFVHIFAALYFSTFLH